MSRPTHFVSLPVTFPLPTMARNSFQQTNLPITPLLRLICAEIFAILLKTRNLRGEGDGVPQGTDRAHP